MTVVLGQLDELKERIVSSAMPEDLKNLVGDRLEQLRSLTESATFLPEYDRLSKYIEWILRIPWNNRTQDVLDLEQATQVLEAHHYGLQEIKTRILEYIAVMKLKHSKGTDDGVIKAPVLCFVGLVGTGKTTIASSIAEALGREFVRIPFGGMGSPLDLRGQSRSHPEAEPGKIIKALVQAKSRNCVILLDEIDRVTDEGRASIMGVLVELLDPGQNVAFVDHYIDYPVNLSEVLFVATANNTHHIATAVLDRLEPITLPSYSDHEKITIGKKYMYPKIIKEAGLDTNTIVIEDSAWAKIVRPLGFDPGMRTLQRTISGVVRKVARMVVEGKGTQFVINEENVKQYLPQ